MGTDDEMAYRRETARSLEIILSRLKFDDQTARVLKWQLDSERQAAARLEARPTPSGCGPIGETDSQA